jgi:hypothetical protein
VLYNYNRRHLLLPLFFMSIFNNLRNGLKGFVQPQKKQIRSFEDLTPSNNLNSGCSYISQGSKFYPVHKTAESLSDHPTFANTYNLISNKIYSSETYIRSNHKNISKALQRDIEEIGFNRETRLRVFDILYKGAGACLCFLEENKLRVVPFFQGEELVRIIWNRYGDRIESIAFRSESRSDYNWYSLDLKTANYFILSNIKESDTFKSNLTIAAPYILLSNALLKRDINFANDDFNVKPIITPNIDKLVTKNGVAEVTYGGETIPMSQFLTKNIWGNIRNDINDRLRYDKLPVLPFDVSIKSLAQNNSQNQTNLIRDYAEDMITRACHSSSSILGKTGSNRAESEQQRDNFDQQVVKTFQDLVCRVANEFLIPLLAPHSHSEFVYQYYSEETDESIKLRDQQLKLAELIISPDFELFKSANNLRLDFKQIAELFQTTHGLELITENEEIETAESTIEGTRAYGEEDIDSVYSEYRQAVNMSYSELKAWSENPKSKLASDSREPVNRNLYLLEQSKADWTVSDLPKAKKTIAYIARAKTMGKGVVTNQTEPYGRNEIAMKNWAYDINNNKSSRSFSFEDSVRAINIQTLDFSNIESNKEYNKKCLVPLSNALQLQYQAIKKANSLRVNIDSNEFDNFLKPEDLQRILKNVANITLNEYISKTGSSIQKLPKTIDELLKSLVDLHFSGGTVQDFDADGNPVDKEYNGFNASQKERLANLAVEDMTDSRIQELVKNQVQSISNNLFLPLFGQTYETLSVEDGAEYLGTVAKNDQLVRDWHLANSGYAWRIGSNPPDSTNPEFYLERFCRCSRVYGAKEQLQKGGFKIFN